MSLWTDLDSVATGSDIAVAVWPANSLGAVTVPAGSGAMF